MTFAKAGWQVRIKRGKALHHCCILSTWQIAHSLWDEWAIDFSSREKNLINRSHNVCLTNCNLHSFHCCSVISSKWSRINTCFAWKCLDFSECFCLHSTQEIFSAGYWWNQPWLDSKWPKPVTIMILYRTEVRHHCYWEKKPISKL